jgi:hypothetical protein
MPAKARTRSPWPRLDGGMVHKLLVARCVSPGYVIEHRSTEGFVEPQALDCPYYVPLEGSLGSDWGVIVNPLSTRFGLLTFEHDYCGCLRDCGDGTQTTDEWRQ